jgi:hypothetical protein
MPDGLTYVSSWVEPTLDRCYQVIETADPELLEWGTGRTCRVSGPQLDRISIPTLRLTRRTSAKKPRKSATSAGKTCRG